MSKKISELDIATAVNNEDILILNQNDETKQISKEDLFADTEQHIDDSVTALTGLIGVEEYSNEQTYEIGDYCLHEGVLYVCIVAITTPEVWDSAKWQEANILENTARKSGGTTVEASVSFKLGGLTIQTGRITGVSVPATGYTGINVTFPKAFDSNPNVIMTPMGNYNIGGQVSSTSTTGFVLNVRSIDGNARTNRTYTYIAIGI